jgi:hypothetical protein
MLVASALLRQLPPGKSVFTGHSARTVQTQGHCIVFDHKDARDVLAWQLQRHQWQQQHLPLWVCNRQNERTNILCNKFMHSGAADTNVYEAISFCLFE